MRISSYFGSKKSQIHFLIITIRKFIIYFCTKPQPAFPLCKIHGSAHIIHILLHRIISLIPYKSLKFFKLVIRRSKLKDLLKFTFNLRDLLLMHFLYFHLCIQRHSKIPRKDLQWLYFFKPAVCQSFCKFLR